MNLPKLAWVLLLWGTLQAHAAVTSPLGGYCRPGKYVPLKTDAPINAFRFDFPGAVPVFGQKLQPGAVVPMLILETPRSNIPDLALKPLEPDQRLVAFTGEPSLSLASEIFQDDHPFAIHLDSLEGPAIAYNALDALIFDAPLPPTTNLQSLWIAGVSVGVRGAEKPDDILPWEKKSWGWMLSARWAGPNRAGDNPFAMSCVEGWTPTYPDSHRHKVALLGVFTALAFLGATLAPRRWKFSLTLTLGVALSASWIVWGQQVNPTCVQTAQIATTDGQFDQWSFHAALKPAELHIPWTGAMFPIGATNGVSLECDEKGAPIGWKATLKPNQKLGMLSRTFRKNEDDEAGSSVPEFSRLSRLVNRSYLLAGRWEIQNFKAGETDSNWGAVILTKR